MAMAPAGPTTPVTIGGKTLNVSSNDAAAINAWKARLGQLITARYPSQGTVKIDGSMGEKDTRDYVVPIAHGAAKGVLTLPADVEVGAWFAGSDQAKVGATALKPAGPQLSPVAQEFVSPTQPPPSNLPALQPVEMTAEAVNAARAKYPSSEGWNEVWLPGGGKVFAKGDPCDMHALTNALLQVDNPDAARAKSQSQPTVDDYARGAKAAYDSQFSRGRIADPHFADPKPVIDDQEQRYTLIADSAPRQAESIRSAMQTTPDDGRLERALAVTELTLPQTWKQGVDRLASAYLAHPRLAAVGLDEDFSGASGETIRQMLGRIVADANRTNDARSWTAVAALMAAQGRPERALAMIERARKATQDDELHGALGNLAKAINALPRSQK